jgi:histidine triad (HIT) family protein
MTLHVDSDGSCPFCEYLNGERPCAFVTRGEVASAFVNPTQYERGALLVVPNRHVETILDTSAEDVSGVAQLVRKVSRALDAAFDPTGINVFQNNGVASGQHVAHYHVHVVPRYDAGGPMRLFRQADFPLLDAEELEPVAVELRRALATLEVP